MSFDARDFRRALGQFATGVAVVTASDRAGTPIGMTMSSFNSVSLDPPLILFSVDRRALSLPAMLEAEGYAVNLLSRRQEHLSNQFAKALADKWQAVEHTLGHAQAPLIRGAWHISSVRPAPFTMAATMSSSSAESCTSSPTPTRGR